MNHWKKKALAVVTSAAVGMMLLAGCSSGQEGTKTIQILETSDVHGHFDTFDYSANEEDTTGGLTQIGYVVNQLREENPNTLVVDAGDMVQGNMADYFIDDDLHPMFAAMNEIGYDTWTIGNHEFNYGPDYLEKFVEEPDATVLCGNIYKPDGTRLGEAYTVKEVDGVRVGIIGMTTPNIMRWDGQKYSGWTVTSPIEETQKAIAEMEEQNLADIYVAVVHEGETEEYSEDDSATALAEACPELCAVMCGHLHQAIECDHAGNAVITEPGCDGEYLSQVQITVKEDGNGGYDVVDSTAQLISMDGQPVDPNVEAVVQPYHERGVAHTETQIGTLSGGPLVPEDEINGVSEALLEDTPLLDLINDTITYYASQEVPDNGGHLVSAASLTKPDSNAQEGSIRYCDVYDIYQYNNQMIVLQMTGEQLKEYMEWSAAFYNQFEDGDTTISFDPDRVYYTFDAFSGVNYQIDISQPEGSRIVNLTYSDGTSVGDDDVIYLATTDYRVTNNLNGDIFADNPCEQIYTSANTEVEMIRDMIVQYIAEVKDGKITNTCDNNWSIIGADYDPAYHSMTVDLLNNGTIQLPDDGSSGKCINTKSIKEADVQQYVDDYPQYFNSES